MKLVFSAVLAFAIAACHSSDGTAPITQPNDISSMNVGDVRVLTPDQIPNGINLPATSSARDYVIIVGNTNPTIDAVANFVLQSDRTAGASANIVARTSLNSQLNIASEKIDFWLDFPVGADASSCFASPDASICGSASGVFFTWLPLR